MNHSAKCSSIRAYYTLSSSTVYWHSTESNSASPTAQSKLKFFKWIYPPRIWHWSKIHCPNTEYPHKYTVPILSIHIKTEPVTAGEDAICTCICPLSSFVYILVHYTQYTVLCISGPETSQIPLRLLLLWPAWVFMRRFRFFLGQCVCGANLCWMCCKCTLVYSIQYMYVCWHGSYPYPTPTVYHYRN